MSEMTLFGNKSTAISTLLGDDDDLAQKVVGTSGHKRISIEGNVFREIVGGKEVRVAEERALQVVLLKTSPIGRTFYAGTYQKGVKAKPTCWSPDGNTPDAKVPVEQRQSDNCKFCPQNIKGSASQGDGRACRFSVRAAVALAGDNGVDDSIYQVSLPATSVFGDADGQKMPLQAYGRYLAAHNTHSASVVTEMRFDPAGQMKLVFKPIRPLSEDEVRQVAQMRNHPDAVKAITMTVSEADQEQAKPAAALFANAPKAAPKAAPAPVEAEEVEEPVKVAKKATVTPVKNEIADLVGEWDDV